MLLQHARSSLCAALESNDDVSGASLRVHGVCPFQGKPNEPVPAVLEEAGKQPSILRSSALHKFSVRWRPAVCCLRRLRTCIQLR